jgi:hypothetical protein
MPLTDGSRANVCEKEREHYTAEEKVQTKDEVWRS